MTTIPDVMAAEDMIRRLNADIGLGEMPAGVAEALAYHVAGVIVSHDSRCEECARIEREADEVAEADAETIERLENENEELSDQLDEARRELAEYHRGEADSARHRL